MPIYLICCIFRAMYVRFFSSALPEGVWLYVSSCFISLLCNILFHHDICCRWVCCVVQVSCCVGLCSIRLQCDRLYCVVLWSVRMRSIPLRVLLCIELHSRVLLIKRHVLLCCSSIHMFASCLVPPTFSPPIFCSCGCERFKNKMKA